jgi:amino acid permease
VHYRIGEKKEKDEAMISDLSQSLLPASRRRATSDYSQRMRARSVSTEATPMRWSLAGGSIGRSSSWNNLARLAHHVEDTLLHNEQGAPKTIGRILPDNLTRGASLRTTVFNMVSTMIGGGMLSLPWVLAEVGVGGGLFLMVFVPLLTERTISFVAEATDTLSTVEKPLSLFPAVVEAALGTRAALLCAATLIVLSYGVCVSYCVVIKGLLPGQLQALSLGWLSEPPSQTVSLVFVSVTCLLPLSALKTVEAMRYASIASVVLVYAFVGLVCVAGVTTLSQQRYQMERLLSKDWLLRGGLVEWLRVVPVVGLSYMCGHNVPSFYKELRRHAPTFGPGGEMVPSPRRLETRWRSKPRKFQAGAQVAMLIASVLYLATAGGGYAAFGLDAQSNVLLNFVPGQSSPLPDLLIFCMKLAFSGTMISTFPTISHGLRTSLHALCFPGRNETTNDRWLEAGLLVGLIVTCAASVSNLGLVFQLLGSTCGAILMFLLPACLRLFGKRERADESGVAVEPGGVRNHGTDGSVAAAAGRPGGGQGNVFAWLALIYGLVLLLGSSFVTFLGVSV